MGGDAEGKVIAGEVSFLSVWPGKGGRGGEYCCGGCGRWRERKFIQHRWVGKGALGALKGALLRAVQGSAGVGDTGG